jgi:dipeptidase E
MRLLLISNSGRPFLEHCRAAVAEFLGPRRRVGFVTAASLGDERLYWARARDALAPAGLDVVHVYWRENPLPVLAGVEAVFVGGGNTYALLKRLRESGLLAALRERVLAGLPYLGSSAGANVAGPTILTTNDWNVVALDRFDALGLVPFNINPHYLAVDPAMAPGSETRDDRIREYLAVNANPVYGIEEETLIRVEDDRATVRGRGRVAVFRRNAEPAWYAAGQAIPAPRPA